MTSQELLQTCRQAGIRVAADGDSLLVDAPMGLLTPALREALARHKPALLARLAPVEFVTFRGGVVLPLPAVLLALDLKRRGFTMTRDEGHQFAIEPTPALTEADLAAIDQWRPHLTAIVGYDADAHGGVH